MRLIFFFSRWSNFHFNFQNAKQYGEKSLIFKINAIDIVAVKSPYYGEDTGHRQSLG